VENMTETLADKLRKIKLVIFDVDGVLTDNTIFMGADGFEMKRFNIADGLGTYMAIKHGIKIAFLSGRPSAATERRAKELGVEDAIQTHANKLDSYELLKLKYDYKDENIAFMGNDLIDVGVMKKCGLAVAVPDSPQSVIANADFVTTKQGGFGASREFLDMILDARGIDEEKRLA
jgi:3-deoxy-D-manno-octulosonate 8-phosphate phosphatase (KDO 8-P phosphatase)